MLLLNNMILTKKFKEHNMGVLKKYQLEAVTYLVFLN